VTRRRLRFLCLWAVSLALTSPVVAQNLQLKSVGTTYARAQVASWLEDGDFAVGRWDGTLSIFRPPRAGGYGPVLLSATAAPSRQPIQMILAVSPTVFVSSNDDHSLAVWKVAGGHCDVVQIASYDRAFGVADSATQFDWQGEKWIVTGHEQGVIALWNLLANDTLSLKGTLSITSPDPIPSPYHLKNIRGVEHWKGGIVVTGSEDGDIAAVDVVAQRVLFRSRYNPAAQRGINSVSVKGDLALVANCSVGSADDNLWLFQISDAGFHKLDAVNLKKNQQLSQVFDFDAVLGQSGPNVIFLASTEEGLLWLGTVSNGKFVTETSIEVSPTGGAALSFDPSRQEVLSAAYDLGLYDVSTTAAQTH
jgi:WD40 repeat protein